MCIAKLEGIAVLFRHSVDLVDLKNSKKEILPNLHTPQFGDCFFSKHVNILKVNNIQRMEFVGYFFFLKELNRFEEISIGLKRF